MFRSTYIFGPQLTKLRNNLINSYKRNVIPEYSEIIIPKYTNEKLFARSNHIRLPEHSYLLTKFTPEILPITQLNAFLFKQWRVDPKNLRVGGVSTYGVCEPFWSYLENTIVQPFRYFDQSGPAMRNEGNGIRGLQRLDVFSRIELMFAELNNQNLDAYIMQYIQRVKNWLNSIGLYYRVLQVESWAPIHEKQPISNVKTYDFEAYLAYNDSWLEICNVSNNGIIFSKQFNVRSSDKNYLYTGCAGLGIQRLLMVAIEQRGYKHIQTI